MSNDPVMVLVLFRALLLHLQCGEVVHHKDRNKTNNQPSDLWVFKSQAEHDRAHKLDAKRHGWKASYKGFK